MPSVTEFAILRLPPTQQPPTLTLLDNLHIAKLAMESHSGHQFTYLHCVEDPSIIYIIGAWPSIAFHMTDWIPSPKNQSLLTLLKDQMSVDVMFHVSIDQSATPIPIQKPVIAVERYHINSGQRDEFAKAFEHGRRYLDGQENRVGGWRIDREPEDADEFVLFSGWESEERRLEFASTDRSKEYAKIIMEFVDKVEIMHARVLDVSAGAGNGSSSSSR